MANTDPIRFHVSWLNTWAEVDLDQFLRLGDEFVTRHWFVHEDLWDIDTMHQIYHTYKRHLKRAHGIVIFTNHVEAIPHSGRFTMRMQLHPKQQTREQHVAWMYALTSRAPFYALPL